MRFALAWFRWRARVPESASLAAEGVDLVARADDDGAIHSGNRRPAALATHRRLAQHLELIGRQHPHVSPLVHAVDLSVGAGGRGAEDGIAAQYARPDHL